MAKIVRKLKSHLWDKNLFSAALLPKGDIRGEGLQKCIPDLVGFKITTKEPKTGNTH